MQPTELSAGRVQLRPLRCDQRIDDCPALTAALGRPITRRYIERRHREWERDLVYSWAVCESSDPTPIGEATLSVDLMLHSGREGAGLPMRRAAVIDLHPVGEPDREVTAADGSRHTVTEAMMQAAGAVSRWSGDRLGLGVGRVVLHHVAVAGPTPGVSSGRLPVALPIPQP